MATDDELLRQIEELSEALEAKDEDYEALKKESDDIIEDYMAQVVELSNKVSKLSDVIYDIHHLVKDVL